MPHAYQQKKLSTACNGSIRGKLMQAFKEKTGQHQIEVSRQFKKCFTV